MAKLILLIVIILVVTLGVIVISNQSSNTKPAQTLSILPTPTVFSTPTASSPSALPSATISPTVNNQQEVQATKATIKTAKGDIELSLYSDVAPNTVKNFVTKAKSGFYNNLTFHRVEDWVIQGGDPAGNGTGGGNIPVEFNKKPFVVGSLGVASRGDGKVQNDAQFFIDKKDATWLNGQYTNFGIVTKGMDVVNKIEIGDKILGITVE